MLKKSNQKGFTIIEVLIVLAIAGLIMLIVFLAVPALQRNSRNNARQSDASRVAAAVSDCIGNNNGTISNCITAAQLDPTYLVFAENQQLFQFAPSATAPSTFTVKTGTTEATTNRVYLSAAGNKCNSTGTGTASGGARDLAVTYQKEGTGTSVVVQCIPV